MLKRRHERMRQRNEAVLPPFRFADGDGALFKIDILQPQAERFEQAESGTVEERSDEFRSAMKAVQDQPDLGAGEDDGGVFGSFGAEDGADVADRLVEHSIIEEDDGVEGDILGGSGNAGPFGEGGKERADLGGAHFGGVAFIVEEDEAADPMNVGFFGAGAQVAEADGFADLIEKFLCHICSIDFFSMVTNFNPQSLSITSFCNRI